MLSNKDIVYELGRNIAIFPIKSENLKGASYNLTASKYAWVYSPSVKNSYKYKDKIYKSGDNCVYGDTIILFPKTVTLIETEEVLAVSNNIGGTFHSRVSMVNKGIGHISTCLGPNWCGQCLIALHNITDSIIEVKCGDEICSVVFEYIHKNSDMKNQNKTGHTDKFSNYGIKLSDEEEKDLNADWKGSFKEVSAKMCGNINKKKMDRKSEYLILKETYKNNWKQYINKSNIILTIIIVFMVAVMFILAALIERFTGETVWWDRAWSILSSGVIIYIIHIIMNNIRRRD